MGQFACCGGWVAQAVNSAKHKNTESNKNLDFMVFDQLQKNNYKDLTDLKLQKNVRQAHEFCNAANLARSSYVILDAPRQIARPRNQMPTPTES